MVVLPALGLTRTSLPDREVLLALAALEATSQVNSRLVHLRKLLLQSLSPWHSRTANKARHQALLLTQNRQQRRSNRRPISFLRLHPRLPRTHGRHLLVQRTADQRL